MEVIIIKIGFIGAGKVGFSLGRYFKVNNIDVMGYYSKNIKSAEEAAYFTATKSFTDIKSLVEECDTIFITTPDGVIQGIWEELKKLSIQNKLICHCSGSVSSKVFSNIEDHKAYGYSIHPMFAICDKYNSHNLLKEAFITIEGSEEKLDVINDLFKTLGNKTKVICATNKAVYHASSVIVSNLVIALVDFGVENLSKCGFSKEEALEALYPLMYNNIKNIGDKGIINSLTGPVERNDIETIEKHLEDFKEKDRELYKLLSRRLLKIAEIKNKDRCYKKLDDMLGE